MKTLTIQEFNSWIVRVYSLQSDQSNHEVDLLIDRGTTLTAVKIKSGRIIQPDFFRGLPYSAGLALDFNEQVLVHLNA